MLESEQIGWPPGTDATIISLRHRVAELEATLVSAGWEPIAPGTPWYASRFAWTPGPQPQAGVTPSPARHRGVGGGKRRQAVVLAALIGAVAALLAIAIAGRDATAPAGGKAGSTQGLTTFRVGGRPVDLVATGGAIWVADATGRVLALDHVTGAPLMKPLVTRYSPGALAVGSDAAWFTDRSRGIMVPIRFSDSRELAPIPVGGGPADIGLSPGAVWTVGPRQPAVSFLAWERPGVETLPVGTHPVALAANERWVVVVSAQDGTVSRIGAANLAPFGRPLRRPWVPEDVALLGNRAWILDGRDGSVAAVDLVRGDVQARSGALGPEARALAGDGKGVYVLRPQAGELVELDSRTLQVRRREPVDRGASALALDADFVWIADARRGSVLRFKR